jgi:YVTN family beta-propeller protein
MTRPRRSEVQDRDRDRGVAVDLFDDPRWGSHPEISRTPLAWLGHVAFVLFLVLLGLLGLVVVIAGVSLLWLVNGLHLNFGSIDLTPPPPSSYGIDIALSSDGTVAYVTEPIDNRLLVLNAGTGQLLATVAVGTDPSGLALSPDGSQVWVVNTTLSSSALSSSALSSSALSSSAITGSSGTGSAGAGTGSGSVSVVSTATDLVLGTIPVGVGPIDVAFSPDGRTAYVSNNGILSAGSVSVIDSGSLKVLRTLTPTATPVTSAAGSNPTSVAVTADGKEVWVSEVNDLEGSSTSADVVLVFDAATGEQVATIPVGTGPFFLALSRDGREAYVADKLSCDIREIETATFRVVATVGWPPSNGCPYGLARGPDNSTVYTVTGSDQTFNQKHGGHAFGSVDFATAQAHVSGDLGGDPVTLALSPDAATAYVVDADRPVIDLVDPRNGSIKRTFSLPH